jgi:hypothetical protein
MSGSASAPILLSPVSADTPARGALTHDTVACVRESPHHSRVPTHCHSFVIHVDLVDNLMLPSGWVLQFTDLHFG